ncbi:MAG: xylulokinase [Mycobacteriales bacterium]
MAPVTVGIDIGTTAVKALAVDDAGNVLASVRLPHRLRVPAADRLEHRADLVWRDAPRRALAELRRTVDPVAVSVVAMVPSLTAVSRRGVPLGAGLLYGDARGETPERIPGSYLGECHGFLRWLVAEYPRAAGFWPAQAVANHALVGRAAIGTSTAMSAYPLFDGQRWDLAGVEGVGETQLPEVVGDATSIGTEDGLFVDAGGIDALGEQIVSGAVADGDVLVICGSSLVVWAVIPQWREVPGLWTVPHTTPGKFLIGGSTNAGGIFLNWAARLLAAGAVREPREPGPEAVPVWAPYPRGERTPLHDPRRRATLTDLSLQHDAAAVRQAAFEAAGFVVRLHLELAGVSANRIVATGGGTRVSGWVQALADCTGLPVDVAAVPEGAALGAAFLARVAAGLDPTMNDAGRWARVARRELPRSEWLGAASRRYERFKTLTFGAT